MLVIFTNLRFTEISGQALIVSFPKDSIVGPTIFLIYIHDVPADFICNIAIYTDDSASKYD